MIPPKEGINATGRPVQNGLVVPPAGAYALPHYGDYCPPQPDLESGRLIITESIELIAQEFNLNLNLIYDNTAGSTEFGTGWSANVRQYVQSSVSAGIVTVMRGDSSSYGFSMVGSSGGVARYVSANGATSTMMYDGTRFTETYPDGHQLAYQAQVAGGNPVTHQLVNSVSPSGSAQTMIYMQNSGNTWLNAIEVPGGNRATLAYAQMSGSSNWQIDTVTDWYQRVWSFTNSGGNLSSFVAPNGCTKNYTYGGFGMAGWSLSIRPLRINQP